LEAIEMAKRKVRAQSAQPSDVLPLPPVAEAATDIDVHQLDAGVPAELIGTAAGELPTPEPPVTPTGGWEDVETLRPISHGDRAACAKILVRRLGLDKREAMGTAEALAEDAVRAILARQLEDVPAHELRSMAGIPSVS
jgi:hypothetical protein